ncbi:hypothetical protein JYQ62_10015 [Nostoc sp. UHCC 0702]|nr:hypothetical protein JYQ62_10015 [Nostoc sp. UHCC 0702]
MTVFTSDDATWMHISLARLYPKLRTRFSLSGKNSGFLANTFSTSQIIDEVKKVKLPSHRGFSDSDRIAKKMDKVELRGCFKSFGRI